MAAITETKDKTDVLMWNDCHITTSKLCATTGSGKPAVRATSENLDTENVVQGGCRKCSPSNTKLPLNTSAQNFSRAVGKMGMLFCQS
jgi:hypothetical protein